jgi:uncharacterized membrane protein (UPF0136 family)
MQYLQNVVAVILIIGFAAFGIGLTLWIVKMLQQYNVAWELELAFIGAIVLILGILAAKIFSRD